MVKNPLNVTMDQKYYGLLEEIAKADPTYIYGRTNRPNCKRITEDSWRLLHAIKTRRIIFLCLPISQDFEQDELEDIIKLLEGNQAHEISH